MKNSALKLAKYNNDPMHCPTMPTIILKPIKSAKNIIPKLIIIILGYINAF